MPTAHGVIFNDRSLEWGATLTSGPSATRAGAPRLIGKSHLQHGMSRNSVVPSTKAGAVRDPWPTGWNELEHYELYLDAIARMILTTSTASTASNLPSTTAARITGHHLLWAIDQGGQYEDLSRPIRQNRRPRSGPSRWWQVYQPPYGPELHSTTFVTEQTIEFIGDSATGARPWLAMASFPDPHHPFAAPGAGTTATTRPTWRCPHAERSPRWSARIPEAHPAARPIAAELGWDVRHSRRRTR